MIHGDVPADPGDAPMLPRLSVGRAGADEGADHLALSVWEFPCPPTQL
jgi:hypothetical protein